MECGNKKDTFFGMLWIVPFHACSLFHECELNFEKQTKSNFKLD
jgi:hypothetical protein